MFDINDTHTKKHKYDKKLFDRYYHMIDRCYNDKCEAYDNYGGRGITVSDDWRGHKHVFFEWCVVNGYSEDLELDRIDNNLGYSPSNCRFVTRQVNRNNRRDSGIS